MDKRKEFFEKYPDVLEWFRDGVTVDGYDGIHDLILDGTIIGINITSDRPFMIRTEDRGFWNCTTISPARKHYRYMTEREFLLEEISKQESLVVEGIPGPFFPINEACLMTILDNAGQPFTGEYNGEWYLVEV